MQNCRNSDKVCSDGRCINDNRCISHSYQQCSGSVYWYNSCGEREEIAQACTGNQICQNNTCVNQQQQNLTVTKEVRNLSSGNTNWYNYISAVSGDTIQFKITVYAPTTQQNVTVRDIFPAGIIYNNNLTLDGAMNSGNIATGINIGTMSSGQTRIITYQAKVVISGFTYQY